MRGASGACVGLLTALRFRSVGRVHTGKQDLSKLVLAKMKGLKKRKTDEGDADGAGADQSGDAAAAAAPEDNPRRKPSKKAKKNAAAPSE